MIKLVLSEVVAALRGTLRGETTPVSVVGVSTDSRGVAPGELFFALRGDNFDGHNFVSAALQRGALAAVVEAGQAERVAAEVGPLAEQGRLIEVDDVLAALGRLGAYHRRQAPAEVIAVVGSNGKTTTKAMIDHILSSRLKGRCSPKSFNNAIGVPLTLLSSRQGDDYLVVEIGTNAPGEIAQLAVLAEPNMAVLTSIGAEHLEGLGDLAGVAAEEMSALKHVRSGGFAAINADAPEVRPLMDVRHITLATFGRDDAADLRVTQVEYADGWLNFVVNGRFSFRLNMPGTHNAVNAAGALAIARRLGFTHEEVAARLESFVPPPMRAEMLRFGGITLVNDAYNANPHSAAAAIEILESLPCDGRRVAVFGEMCELGEHAARLHREVAERLRGGSIAHVVLVGRAGELMAEVLGASRGSLFGPSVAQADSVDAAVGLVAAFVRPGDAVLLKASRAVGLDRLVAPLRSKLEGAAAVVA